MREAVTAACLDLSVVTCIKYIDKQLLKPPIHPLKYFLSNRECNLSIIHFAITTFLLPIIVCAMYMNVHLLCFAQELGLATLANTYGYGRNLYRSHSFFLADTSTQIDGVRSYLFGVLDSLQFQNLFNMNFMYMSMCVYYFYSISN